MTVKFREIEYNAPSKQVLAIPDHYVALGYVHAKATSATPGLATLNSDNHYIVKAGTIYPANDATAIGIVANDYDVTYGSQNMAVIVHGFIQTSKLTATPSAAAKLAMKQITLCPAAPIANVDVLSKLAIDGSSKLTYNGVAV